MQAHETSDIPSLTVRMPIGGFKVDDLLAMRYHYRLELTDGALTVSPIPREPYPPRFGRTDPMSTKALDQGSRKQRGRRRPAPCNYEAMPFPEDFRPLGPEFTIRMPRNGYTVADLLAMPESQYRIELTDGAITVSPAPSRPHQFMALRLANVLYEASPDDYTVNQAVDVQLGEETTRIPDVLIAHANVGDESGIYQADDIVVAIEIESPSSGLNDRKLKPFIYANRQLPYYWRIELKPTPIAIIHRWENGEYVEVARGPRIDVTEPFPFAVDLATLVDRKA